MAEEDALETHTDLIDEALAALCAVKLGRIESFDPTTGEASVKPLVKRLADVEGEVTEYSQQQIDKVPVFCMGDEDFEIAMPVKVGARCILLFSDEPLSGLLDAGEEAPASKDRKRVHDITDCIALVGWRPFQKRKAGLPIPTDGIAIRHRDGFSAVFKKTHVELGGNGKHAAMAEPIADHLAAIRADLALLKTHVHPGVMAGPGMTSASAELSGMQNPAVPTIASSKVKVGE
jgi:hypothetical protein